MDKWNVLRQDINQRHNHYDYLVLRAFESEDWEAYAGHKGRQSEIDAILAAMDELEERYDD